MHVTKGTIIEQMIFSLFVSSKLPSHAHGSFVGGLTPTYHVGCVEAHFLN